MLKLSMELGTMNDGDDDIFNSFDGDVLMKSLRMVLVKRIFITQYRFFDSVNTDKSCS